MATIQSRSKAAPRRPSEIKAKTKDSAASAPALNLKEARALAELGVTQSQVMELNRSLLFISHLLEMPPRIADIKLHIAEVKSALKRIQRILDAAAAGEASHGVAVADLQNSAALLSIDPDFADRAARDWRRAASEAPTKIGRFATTNRGARMMTLEESIPHLLRVAELAWLTPRPRQERGRVDPGLAIEATLHALRKPADAESRRLVERLRVTPAASRSNPFADIAIIVFSAASSGRTSNLRAAVDHWKKSNAAERWKALK